MKRMKRFLASGLVLLLLLSMAGCGKQEEKKTAAASDVVLSEESNEPQSTILSDPPTVETESAEEQETPKQEVEKTPVRTEETKPSGEKQEAITKRPIGQQEAPAPETETSEQGTLPLEQAIIGKWGRMHAKLPDYYGTDGVVLPEVAVPMYLEFQNGKLTVSFDTKEVDAAALSAYYLACHQGFSGLVDLDERAQSYAKTTLETLNQKRVYQYELISVKTLMLDGVESGKLSYDGETLTWMLGEELFGGLKSMEFTKVK